MTRILISGPPASGKSTLARRLADEHKATLIDFDEIARELGSRSHHDHPDDVRDTVRAEIEQRIDALKGPAVVIRSAPRATEREELARRIGADEVLVLTVPAAEARQRAERDGRPDWTGAAIDRWWSRYQPSEIDQTIEPQEGNVTTENKPPEGDPNDPNANPEGEGEAFDKARAKAKIAKANSEAANLRKKLKEAEAKAAKLDDLENAKKDDLEKANERVASAEKAAQEAELRAIRLEVAAEKGLTNAQAKRLVGADRDELEADADELLTDFPASAGGAGGEGNRQEQLKGGTDPTNEPPDVDALIGSIPPTA